MSLNHQGHRAHQSSKDAVLNALGHLLDAKDRFTSIAENAGLDIKYEAEEQFQRGRRTASRQLAKGRRQADKLAAEARRMSAGAGKLAHDKPWLVLGAVALAGLALSQLVRRH